MRRRRVDYHWFLGFARHRQIGSSQQANASMPPACFIVAMPIFVVKITGKQPVSIPAERGFPWGMAGRCN
jgi:ABC-type amino acid transport system permease subunit